MVGIESQEDHLFHPLNEPDPNRTSKSERTPFLMTEKNPGTLCKHHGIGLLQIADDCFLKRVSVVQTFLHEHGTPIPQSIQLHCHAFELFSNEVKSLFKEEDFCSPSHHDFSFQTTRVEGKACTDHDIGIIPRGRIPRTDCCDYLLPYRTEDVYDSHSHI